MRPILALVVFSSLMQATPAVRLHGVINGNETFVLAGQRNRALASARDLGEVESSLILPALELRFQMTDAQQADLTALLAAQRDRHSASYHKWLTPEQFGARFGVNESDLNKVKQWLERQGFTQTEFSPSRTSIRMSGTAGDVSRAFGTPIHRYETTAGTFYANAENPSLPRALQGLVSGVRGLHNYHVRPFIRRQPLPKISIGINGNHFLAPDDIATIYDLHTLYNQGIDGTGQTIAVAGQSELNVADIEAFQAAANLPIKDPQIVVAGTPGNDADSEAEAALDVEWAGGIGRGAQILFVTSSDAIDSAVYAVEYNLAPIISISYGLCEADVGSTSMQTYDAVFQQANAQGITIVASSGDAAAAGCDEDLGQPETAAELGPAVNFPASSSHVTGVGGTEFDELKGIFWDTNGHAMSYIPEIAWNDTAIENVLTGSGGGISTQFTKPSWQTGIGVPNDQYRDVPDIALSASPIHDPYLICSNGSCSNGFAPPLANIYFVGGTSCGAPVFAGMLALLNQSTKARQGNINPELYSLASFTSGVFHDIELGNNRVPCVTGSTGCYTGSFGFEAGPGYDQVTGLGSIDGTQMVEQWGSDFDLSASSGAIQMSSGSSATANIQVTRFGNFNGNVSLSCAVPASLTNTICSIPENISGSGSVALTISNTKSSISPAVRVWPKEPIPPSVMLFGIAGALFVWAVRRRSLLYPGIAAACLMAASCGGPSVPSTTSVSLANQNLTGNITVTAVSGTLQHSIAVPVTITQ